MNSAMPPRICAFASHSRRESLRWWASALPTSAMTRPVTKIGTTNASEPLRSATNCIAKPTTPAAMPSSQRRRRASEMSRLTRSDSWSAPLALPAARAPRERVEGGPDEGLEDHDRGDVGAAEARTQALEALDDAPGKAESVREPMCVVHGREQRGSHRVNPNCGASRIDDARSTGHAGAAITPRVPSPRADPSPRLSDRAADRRDPPTSPSIVRQIP